MSAIDRQPTRTLVVGREESGERLDQWLTRRVPEHTRSALQRLVRAGKVIVDGRAATKAGLALDAGSTVEIEIPRALDSSPLAQNLALEILHEDDDLLVIDKRAGMVVHPGHGCPSGTVVNALLGRGTRLASLGAPERPGIVHRLDRGTSGVLVVAKNDATHLALSAAFEQRRVRKRYQALVWGHPKPEAGDIDRAIGRSRIDRTRMAVATSGGRSASSSYTTIESLPGFALLAVLPLTGRTHQIRVHLQSIHHPVVGDERYGGRAWRGLQEAHKREAVRTFDRLALHAAELRFTHPASGRELRFEAPLPAEFRSLLEILRKPRR